MGTLIEIGDAKHPLMDKYPAVVFRPVQMGVSGQIGVVISDSNLIVGAISRDGRLCSLSKPLELRSRQSLPIVKTHTLVDQATLEEILEHSESLNRKQEKKLRKYVEEGDALEPCPYDLVFDAQSKTCVPLSKSMGAFEQTKIVQEIGEQKAVMEDVPPGPAVAAIIEATKIIGYKTAAGLAVRLQEDLDISALPAKFPTIDASTVDPAQLDKVPQDITAVKRETDFMKQLRLCDNHGYAYDEKNARCSVVETPSDTVNLAETILKCEERMQRANLYSMYAGVPEKQEKITKAYRRLVQGREDLADVRNIRKLDARFKEYIAFMDGVMSEDVAFVENVYRTVRDTSEADMQARIDAVVRDVTEYMDRYTRVGGAESAHCSESLVAQLAMLSYVPERMRTQGQREEGGFVFEQSWSRILPQLTTRIRAALAKVHSV